MTNGQVDPELVRRAQHGDRDALRKLVAVAYPAVRRWALVRTGDATEADDLTQDVMVQMIRRLDTFKGTAQFSTWLYTVTRHAASDRLRAARRRARLQADPRALEAFTPQRSPTPESAVEHTELGSVIGGLFQELPLRQREVFDLVELQGLSASDAAERMGIEAVSVRAHLFKARKALRERILATRAEWAEEVS